MIAFLIGILDWLFLSVFFWPLLLGIGIWSYATVKRAKYEFAFFPLVLFSVAVFACLWRWPFVKLMFTTWQIIALAVVGYIIAGFLVSLYKYLMELHDFKKEAPEVISRYKKDNPKEQGRDLHTLLQRILPVELDLPSHSIDIIEKDGQTRFSLKYTRFPIALWWTYWPLYVFSIVLDPLTRFIDWAYDKCKAFYNWLSNKFSVSV